MGLLSIIALISLILVSNIVNLRLIASSIISLYSVVYYISLSAHLVLSVLVLARSVRPPPHPVPPGVMVDPQLIVVFAFF